MRYTGRDMADRRRKSGAFGPGGRWFIAALLFALASALVPALCHSGFPASRLTGSAFDPTTSTVALRSRAHRIVRPAAVTREDAGGPAVIQPLLVPASPIALALRATIRPIATPFAPAAPRAIGRRRAPAQPRAPPARRG